jgi:hypothetical protein
LVLFELQGFWRSFPYFLKETLLSVPQLLKKQRLKIRHAEFSVTINEPFIYFLCPKLAILLSTPSYNPQKPKISTVPVVLEHPTGTVKAPDFVIGKGHYLKRQTPTMVTAEEMTVSYNAQYNNAFSSSLQKVSISSADNVLSLKVKKVPRLQITPNTGNKNGDALRSTSDPPMVCPPSPATSIASTSMSMISNTSTFHSVQLVASRKKINPAGGTSSAGTHKATKSNVVKNDSENGVKSPMLTRASPLIRQRSLSITDISLNSVKAQLFSTNQLNPGYDALLSPSQTLSQDRFLPKNKRILMERLVSLFAIMLCSFNLFLCLF